MGNSTKYCPNCNSHKDASEGSLLIVRGRKGLTKRWRCKVCIKKSSSKIGGKF